MAAASTTLAAGDASMEQFAEHGGSIYGQVKKMTQYFTAHTTSAAEVLKMLGSSPMGLTFEKAVVKRDMRDSSGGGGEIPPPHDTPAWLCCLAPCLIMTEEMEQYSACVAKQATVLRQGYSMDTLLMDASVSAAHTHAHPSFSPLLPSLPGPIS